MSITSIARDYGIGVNIVRVVTDDTLATVAGAGYVTDQTANIDALNEGGWTWLNDDVVLVSASDGHDFFQFTVTAGVADFSTFVLMSTAGNGAVTLPVVSGNFTVFDGTLGALKDLGYLPSDASKTRVVMAGSAVQVGYLAHFIDTTGTIDDTAGAVINAGTIQSGLSGTVGGFIAYPPTAANGFLELLAVNAGGAFNTIISNSAMGQTSTISIPDPGVVASKFLLTDSAGTQTVATGSLAFTLGYSQVSAVNALTAHAGGGQGSATALTRQINRVTTVASGGDSVVLPAAVAGRWVTVINAAAANSMDVFPASGQAINALANDTALAMAANVTATFYCAVNGTWNAVVTA